MWVLTMSTFTVSGIRLAGKQLALILHSPGSSAEAAERIVTYIRKRFDID
jgi:hypothetical protein